MSKLAVNSACCQAIFCTTALISEGCHDLCYSALLLVIVPLCEQQTFTSKLAVKHACCQASVLQCTVAGYSAFV